MQNNELNEIAIKYEIDLTELKKRLLQSQQFSQIPLSADEAEIIIYRFLISKVGITKARMLKKELIKHLDTLLSQDFGIKNLETEKSRQYTAEPSASVQKEEIQAVPMLVTGPVPKIWEKLLPSLTIKKKITISELGEYLIPQDQRQLKQLTQLSGKNLVITLTKRLLSWNRTFGEDEDDIDRFLFQDFQETRIVLDNNIIQTQEFWNRFGISINWPEIPKNILPADIIFRITEYVIRYLMPIYELKRILRKIQAMNIIETPVEDLIELYRFLLSGKVNVSLIKFGIPFESTIDFNFRYSPDEMWHFITLTENHTKNAYLRQYFHLLTIIKHARWLGLAKPEYKNASRMSFPELILETESVLFDKKIESLEDLVPFVTLIEVKKNLFHYLIDHYSKELAYLTKIKILQGGMEKKLEQAFAMGALHSDIGAPLANLFQLYLQYYGAEKGQKEYIEYIYDVAVSGISKTENLSLKRTLLDYFQLSVKKTRRKRTTGADVDKEKLKKLLEKNHVIRIPLLVDSFTAQQSIQNAVKRVFNFILGIKIETLLSKGIDRFIASNVNSLWNQKEQKELAEELVRFSGKGANIEDFRLILHTSLSKNLIKHRISYTDEIIADIWNNIRNALKLEPKFESQRANVQLLNEVLKFKLSKHLGREITQATELKDFFEELQEQVTFETVITRFSTDALKHPIINSYYEKLCNLNCPPNLAKLIAGGVSYIYAQVPPNVTKTSPTLEEKLYHTFLDKITAIWQVLQSHSLDNMQRDAAFKQFIFQEIDFYSTIARISEILQILLADKNILNLFDYDTRALIVYFSQEYLKNWIRQWINLVFDFIDQLPSANDTMVEQIMQSARRDSMLHLFNDIFQFFPPDATKNIFNELNSLKQYDWTPIPEYLPFYSDLLATLIFKSQAWHSTVKKTEFPLIDITFTRVGEKISLLSSLFNAKKSLDPDIITELVGLNVIHGFSLQSCTLKKVDEDFFLTISYSPRIQEHSDITGIATQILSKQPLFLDELDDIQNQNAKIVTAITDTFKNPENKDVWKTLPLVKSLFELRLSYMNIKLFRRIPSWEELKTTINVKHYSLNSQSTIKHLNFALNSIFRLNLLEFRVDGELKIMLPHMIEFYGKNSLEFGIFIRLYASLLNFSTSITKFVENRFPWIYKKTRIQGEGNAPFLPYYAVFKVEKNGSTVDSRTIIFLSNIVSNNTTEVATLFEEESTEIITNSLRKIQFILNAHMDKKKNCWKVQHLAEKEFNLPVHIPWKEIVKYSADDGIPYLDETIISQLSIEGE